MAAKLETLYPFEDKYYFKKSVSEISLKALINI